MSLVMDLLLMLGGVAVFMFGMKQMNVGIEKSSGSGVRNLFKKINMSRMVNYGVGLGVASIVHSSTTTIMTVGLANAKIVTVKQGAGMVLGAKVGTTIMAFVLALTGHKLFGDFSFSSFFAGFAFLGIIIIYTANKEKLINIATLILGFGMLFVGLEVMEVALKGSDLQLALTAVFQFNIMHNPFFLVLLGVLFTFIIQSSTAATMVFLAFLGFGPEGDAVRVISSVDQSFFLVMGANIGTCSDGIMAAIGTNAFGKRIAAFHTLTSTIGAVVFSVILVILRAPIVAMFEKAFADNMALSLATFNLVYNSVYTLILIFFLTPLVELVSKMFKEKSATGGARYELNEALLATPSVAVDHAMKEVAVMSKAAWENYHRAFNGIVNCDTSESGKIANEEYVVDEMTRVLAEFFIKISSSDAAFKDEKLIGGLHHVIDDIERIGDHAVTLASETSYMKKEGVKFLDETKEELRNIFAQLTEMNRLSYETFTTRKSTHLKKISELHESAIKLISVSMDLHIERLGANMYSVAVSKSVYAALQSLHRVSDHMVNVSFSILSDTGSKREAFDVLESAGRKSLGV